MKYLAYLLTALIALPAAAQFRPGHHYTLTAGRVAQSIAGSLAERGIVVRDSQISLLSQVTAGTPDPALEVSSIETLPNTSQTGKSETRSAVRVACRVATECLPFYAIVRWPDGVSPPSAKATQGLLAKPVAAAKETPVLIMRAGAHAILILQDGAAQIQLNVVSLQNGAAGQKIRVAGEGNRQVYLAQVISPTLLQGGF
jgi:hypothetical protein